MKYQALKGPTLYNVFKKMRQGEPIKVIVEIEETTESSSKTSQKVMNLVIHKVLVETNFFIVYGVNQEGQRFALSYTKKLPSQQITGTMILVQ